MNVYTFILHILIASVLDYKLVSTRATYVNPSYNNDRDESLSAAAHLKKRLANEDAFREEDQQEEYERSAPLYESQHYRKYEPESSYARYDNRLEKNRELADFDDSKLNNQKREYYDSASNHKDASIEVILDPRAKKAVAVVENSPNGQAMYDLSGWKNNKDDSSGYDSDQYTPGVQEQVVNLVYPAERNERKYSASAFDYNSDYSDKSKGGFKDKLGESERASEDTHKKKRNIDAKINSGKENEKRSVQDKAKRKSDTKSDSIKSNECPPHNTPSTMETDSKKGDDEDKFTKDKLAVKRETPQWSKQQLDALKNSLAHVNEKNGEVQNLKNILMDMGLINEPELTNKRDTAKADAATPTEKLDEKETNSDLKADAEDEDLNHGNLILRRNTRKVDKSEEETINKAPEEPVEKREAEEENNSEEETNEEAVDNQDKKKDVKRSNTESEAFNADTKEETNAKEEPQSRETHLDAEMDPNSNNKAETVERNKDAPALESEMNKNTVDNTKKYIKRDTNSDTSKELRKDHANKETNEEYEQRMESQIQAKIDAIKEKVKREILEEQFRKRAKRNPNTEEAFKSHGRKRRQTKEQAKEEAVEDTENANNKEKSVESPTVNPSEAQVKRRKRSNILPEKQMVYRAYQADQDEAEDDAEFDDNAYDGRMYLEKRQAVDENDYYDPVRKREVEGYLRQYYPEARNRRSSFNDGFAEDSNAFHGSRRALKNKGFTGRENQEDYKEKSIENTDSEYFGTLPQNSNGELTRYKRVKRDNPYK